MACRCIDILESHYFIHSSLLAGNNGLNNPIRWPYVAELSGTLDSLPDFVRSGDGLIIMGDILKDSPDTLDRIFHYSVTLNLSILIFYQSKYLSVFPERLLELANTNNIPVVLLDQNAAPISDIVYDISYKIAHDNDTRLYARYGLMDLLSRPLDVDYSAVIYRGKTWKLDLSLPHRGILISYQDKKYPSMLIKDNSILSYIDNTCEQVLSRYYTNILMSPLSNVFGILLPENTYKISIGKLAKNILAQLLKGNSDYYYYIGIGNSYADVEDFHMSINEAQRVLNAAQTMGFKNQVLEVNEMLTPLFLHSQMDNPLLMRLIKQNIEPLLEADKNDKFQLHQTLRTYMACDKNIGLAANKLYIHRNTLTSRLTKIQEILNKDLNNVDHCFELSLSLFAYKLYRSQESFKVLPVEQLHS